MPFPYSHTRWYIVFLTRRDNCFLTGIIQMEVPDQIALQKLGWVSFLRDRTGVFALQVIHRALSKSYINVMWISFRKPLMDKI
jgi:hypothetical protein